MRWGLEWHYFTDSAHATCYRSDVSQGRGGGEVSWLQEGSVWKPLFLGISDRASSCWSLRRTPFSSLEMVRRIYHQPARAGGRGAHGRGAPGVRRDPRRAGGGGETLQRRFRRRFLSGSTPLSKRPRYAGPPERSFSTASIFFSTASILASVAAMSDGEGVAEQTLPLPSPSHEVLFKLRAVGTGMALFYRLRARYLLSQRWKPRSRLWRRRSWL